MNSLHDCNYNLNVFVVVVSITKQQNQNSLGIALVLIGHRRHLCTVSTELRRPSTFRWSFENGVRKSGVML